MLLRGCRVLDAGCGNGDLGVVLCTEFLMASYTGYDLDEHAIRSGRAAVEERASAATGWRSCWGTSAKPGRRPASVRPARSSSFRCTRSRSRNARLSLRRSEPRCDRAGSCWCSTRHTRRRLSRSGRPRIADGPPLRILRASLGEPGTDSAPKSMSSWRRGLHWNRAVGDAGWQLRSGGGTDRMTTGRRAGRRTVHGMRRMDLGATPGRRLPDGGRAGRPDPGDRA